MQTGEVAGDMMCIKYVFKWNFITNNWRCCYFALPWLFPANLHNKIKKSTQ